MNYKGINSCVIMMLNATGEPVRLLIQHLPYIGSTVLNIRDTGENMLTF